MSQREKFLYDLNGFLVVEDALSSDEVAALNAAFDANWSQLGYAAGSVTTGSMASLLMRTSFEGCASGRIRTASRSVTCWSRNG